MSFLLGGAYDSSGSSSSSESEAEGRQLDAPEAVKGGDGGGGGGERRRSTQAALPSADSILDSVATATASFRAPRPPKGAASTPLKTFDLLEEEKQRRQKQREQQREAARRGERQPRKRPRETSADDPAPRPGHANTKDKRDAKERVKQQRVKGQAGIGSDFRAWKSETEMALRQQFD